MAQSKFTEADLYLKAQTDPQWWMNQCGWTLWEKQLEIIEALRTHNRVAVPAAFGVGKTWLGSRLTAWWLNTHYPSKVITTAPTTRQVKDLLWAEIRDAYHNSKMPLGGEVLTTDIRLEPNWFATGFATNEEHIDKFTGYHSPNMLLIFDQACGIHPAIWGAGEGLLTSENCKWIVFSNTTDENSVMADICLPDRRSEHGGTCDDPNCQGCGKWKIVKIRAWDSPNVVAGRNVFPGVLSHDYIEKKREQWYENDPFWQIYIEANFVEAGAMTVLHPSMVKELLHKNEVEPDMSQIIIGLDIGDEGMDPSVWTVGLGQKLGWIEMQIGNNPMQVVNHTIKVWDKVVERTGTIPTAINYDKIGIGSGVGARLSEMGYPVIGVNTGMQANDTEAYMNRRIEMAWAIRELAEARALSLKPLYWTDPQIMSMLREDMGIRFVPLPSQKIKLEDKGDFRNRLKRSSDIWDSMCLAMAGTTAPEITGIDAGLGGRPPRNPIDLANQVEASLEDPDNEKLLVKLFGAGLIEESDWGTETFFN